MLQDELKDRIKAILLFGSHAGGIITRRSDIDIAVIFTDISLEEATNFRMRISAEFDQNMDIQVFNVLPQKMKRSIARRHRVMHQKRDFDNRNFTIHYLKNG